MTEKITKHENIIYVKYKNEKSEIHNINDEPAFIWNNGGKHWYRNNKLHRSKGPAIIYPNGGEYWFYGGINITDKVNQLMKDDYISSDWHNWSEEDEFLFVLLVS